MCGSLWVCLSLMQYCTSDPRDCTLQVIVHGLPFSFAWQELKDLFKPVGGVSMADIVLDQEGRSRGWGTVTFQTPADADRAIQVVL